MRILAPMITVRLATKEDIGAIVPQWMKLMKMHEELNAYWTPSANAESFVRSDLATWMDDDNMFVFVAVDGKTIVGYAIGTLSHLPPEFKDRYKAYIRDTWVEPEYRSKQVGKLLVDGIKKYIKSKGSDMCDVEVAIQNERGLKFWKEQGFMPMTIRLIQDI